MKALKIGIALLLAVLLVVIAVLAYQALSNPGLDRDALARDGIVLLPEPREVPEITLVDHQGQPFTMGTASEQWSLVFFGYTFCPDICPTTLADLRAVMKQLPESARAQTRVIMVSVDPTRDTPPRLKEYLTYFSPEYIGLTGDLEAVQAVSSALGVPFIPAADTSREHYTVDHSGNLAIVNPQGDLHGFIRGPVAVPRLAASLPLLLEQGPER